MVSYRCLHDKEDFGESRSEPSASCHPLRHVRIKQFDCCLQMTIDACSFHHFLLHVRCLGQKQPSKILWHHNHIMCTPRPRRSPWPCGGSVCWSPPLPPIGWSQGWPVALPPSQLRRARTLDVVKDVLLLRSLLDFVSALAMAKPVAEGIRSSMALSGASSFG